MANTNTTPEGSLSARPAKGNPLRWIVVAVVLVLAGIALVLRLASPSQDQGVYTPPPTPTKTAAQIEAQIKTVQDNKDIPARDKGRILGFLNAELQKKNAEGQQAAPAPK